MSRFFAAQLQQADDEPEDKPETIEEVDDDDKKPKKKKKGAKMDDKEKEEKAEADRKKKEEEAKKKEEEKRKKEEEKKKKDEEKRLKEEEAKKKKAEAGEEDDEGDEDDKDQKAGAGKKKKKKDKPVSHAAKLLAEKMAAKKQEDERIKQIEEEMKRKEEEEERARLEAERLKKEEEDRIAAEKAAAKQKLIDAGEYMSKAERKRRQAAEKAREQLLFTQQQYEIQLQQANTASPEKEGVTAETTPNQRKKSRNEQKAEELAKKVMEESPKKKKSSHHEPKEAPVAQEKAQVVDTTEQKPKNDDFDDWENLLNEEDIRRAEEHFQEKKETLGNAPAKSTKSKPKTHKKGGKDKQEKELAEKAEEMEEDKEECPIMENPIYSKGEDVFNVKSRFRCPIICILGHVDTGKTKILDKIRRTNVQTGEAGGITQQIGASFFPQYKLKEEITKLDSHYKKIDVEIPGLLIIDTPGHESFSNLRKRGESLCDFAILVVDVKHGLENQTIESLNMLRDKGTPFIVALNKIDIVKDWKSIPDGCSLGSLKSQSPYTQNLYQEYFNRNQTDFAEQGILIQNYWENIDIECNQSVVPTSAISGEGIPDLLGYITDYCQTVLEEKITPNENFNCSVMEVKKVEGLGTTIDIVLVDGTLKEGDKIVLSGFEGPIHTTVRALLTPQPLKELRVKADYIHHEEIKGAMGCKVAAPSLEKAIAGTSMYKYTNDDELPDIHELLADDISRVRKMVKFKSEGVGVVASTLGSLEALLVFLKSEKIPVSNVSIGDITKEDVMRSQNALLVEDERKRRKEYATILAFDVKALPEADLYAKKTGVHIIHAEIIYHLCDAYKAWQTKCQNDRKEQQKRDAIFPCVVKPLKFFNVKDPIVMGCDVTEGVLKLGTPLCVFKDVNKTVLGIVESIESNHKPITEAKPSTGSVAVKIKGLKDTNYTAGRTFDLTDLLYSNISRKSIDCLKDNFRDEMHERDWDLLRTLKTKFNIV